MAKGYVIKGENLRVTPISEKRIETGRRLAQHPMARGAQACIAGAGRGAGRLDRIKSCMKSLREKASMSQEQESEAIQPVPEIKSEGGEMP